MKTRSLLALFLTILLSLSMPACSKHVNSNEHNDQTAAHNVQSEQNTKTEDNSEKSTDNSAAETNIKTGVLTAFVDKEGKPRQNEFVIDGIILIGNRHAYKDISDNDDIIKHFADKGYHKTEINSSFYLNEYIEFYIDTPYSGPENDVKILVVPQKNMNEYEKMSSDDLTSLAQEKGFVLNYKTPEAENYKYVGEAYVDMENPEGKYDILFIYKDKPAYLISIEETKEPN